MSQRMDGPLGEHHAGDSRRETAAGRAERIRAEEWRRSDWTEAEWVPRGKSAAGKLASGARLRRKPTLPLRGIAARAGLGTSRRANRKVHLWMKEVQQPAVPHSHFPVPDFPVFKNLRPPAKNDHPSHRQKNEGQKTDEGSAGDRAFCSAHLSAPRSSGGSVASPQKPQKPVDGRILACEVGTVNWVERGSRVSGWAAEGPWVARERLGEGRGARQGLRGAAGVARRSGPVESLPAGGPGAFPRGRNSTLESNQSPSRIP